MEEPPGNLQGILKESPANLKGISSQPLGDLRTANLRVISGLRRCISTIKRLAFSDRGTNYQKIRIAGEKQKM